MSFKDEGDPRRKTAYLTTDQKRSDRLAYFDQECFPLLGNPAVRVDKEGSISWLRWPEVEIPKSGIIPPAHHIISPQNPAADIYARFSRYTDAAEPTVQTIKKDGGSIETAIRSCDYILFGNRIRQYRQVDAVAGKADELLSLYGMLFNSLSSERFEQNRLEVQALLQDVGLNWETIVSQHKKKMMFWLEKGSFGEDSLQRRNKLISLMALSAAAREAFERKRGLGKIEKKYLGIRQTVIDERIMVRGIFAEISDRFRPEAIPSSVIFRRPQWSHPYDWGILEGMMQHAKYLLKQAKTRTYRQAAQQAIALLDPAIWNIKQRNVQPIIEQNTFAWVKDILDKELEERKFIYKDAKV